ncbi:unnamed protein product [Euphydryas editha]|uniref:NADP-dependent oxidoreductase domain-containing protein n=1 Tax=Euphydryas editha TaxID=104508 RepID=A0AAU9TF51_EUPED|nr:unnamed protein product [Euphydryas editha]
MSTVLTDMPKYKMNNGLEIPAIALGTFLGFDERGLIKSENKMLRDVVLQAIDVGYRHFDTAAVYNTEDEVGEAVRMKVGEGRIKREDVFVTTKLWNTRHRREQVVKSLEETLQKMGLEYIDLYLMHWPIGLNDDYTHTDTDYMETWRGLEDAQQAGLTKSIGLSNFNKQQLKRVIDEGRIKPAVIQIEVHPQIVQKELIEYAHSLNVVVMGYSPFGSMIKRYGIQFPGPRFDDPVLVDIAEKYGKTTAQVVLRWLVDRDIIPIAKTVKYSRLKENIDIFDFKLDPEEIEMINSFNSNTRYTLPSFWQTHRHYPFEKVENPIADPFIKN